MREIQLKERNGPNVNVGPGEALTCLLFVG
ncbi:UNVERIFIED_ORG: hypothetical protein J2Y93_004362 [Pantoea agglomerans]|jgi:hypothetical protein